MSGRRVQTVQDGEFIYLYWAVPCLFLIDARQYFDVVEIERVVRVTTTTRHPDIDVNFEEVFTLREQELIRTYLRDA